MTCIALRERARTAPGAPTAPDGPRRPRRRADAWLAHRLNFGALEAEWQEHLNAALQQSKEHVMPWTVEGNLEVVAAGPGPGPAWATAQAKQGAVAAAPTRP